MNKIENAIYQIDMFDKQINQKSIFNQLHPLFKLLLTFLYLILLTSINPYDIFTTIAMGIYLFIISIVGNLPIKNCKKQLKVVLLLLIIVGIANPIIDRRVITYINNIPITTGMISFITLLIKGSFALINTYFLIATTSIESICYALKMLHLPNMLIIVFMLIYRYITVFLKQVEDIWTAYSMRAPKQKGVHYTAWKSLIGSFMLRSIDRAQNVYESMELRGFSPDMFLLEKRKINVRSVSYFTIGVMLLLILRFIPIFNMIGYIFI